MRKTDKKVDNQLREMLNCLCDNTLKSLTGFEWITHVVNYANFPNSLKIICVFDSNVNLDTFKDSDEYTLFKQLIEQQLSELNIHISAKQLSYDTEENCQKKSAGKWASRLK